MAEKKKPGGQVKVEAEKKSPFPLRLKNTTIEWLERNIPQGNRGKFIEGLILREIEALEPPPHPKGGTV